MLYWPINPLASILFPISAILQALGYHTKRREIPLKYTTSTETCGNRPSTWNHSAQSMVRLTILGSNVLLQENKFFYRSAQKLRQNNSETYTNHVIGHVQLKMSHFMHTFMQQMLHCNTHCLFFSSCLVVSYSVFVSLFTSPYCLYSAGFPVLCLLRIVSHQHSSILALSIPLFQSQYFIIMAYNGLCHPSLIVSLEIQANQRPLKGSFEWCWQLHRETTKSIETRILNSDLIWQKYTSYNKKANPKAVL